MFKFKNGPEAVRELKELLKNEGLTYIEFAQRAGFSKATIDAFVKGRPLTYKVLGAMVKALPEQSARRLAVAHLKDELTRAGLDPATFQISARRPGVLVETIDLMLCDRPERVVEIAALIDKWRDEKGTKLSQPARLENDETRDI